MSHENTVITSECNICDTEYYYHLSDLGINLDEDLCTECYETLLVDTNCKEKSRVLCDDMYCLKCYNWSFSSNYRAYYLDYEKADMLELKEARYVTKGSGKKYPFSSDCGHDFMKQISDVITKDIWCSDKQCIKIKRTTNVIKYCDDFQSDLNVKFDEEKNNFKLSQYSEKSKQKAWWLCTCECGEIHSWQAGIGDIITRKQGCPYCSKVPKKLCPCKSLANVFADLSTEWHPTKNGELTPDDVFAYTGTKVWWLCSKNKCKCKHEWITAISCRTFGRGTNCPFCSHKPFTCKCESLAVLMPEIVKHWHPSKNKELENKGFSIYNIPVSSSKKVWWICDKGHEFECTIADRTRTGQRQIICTVCNESYGERMMKMILDNCSIKYETQFHIKVDTISMFIDFYIRDRNKAIEFDGELHFRVTKFFGGEKKYERTKMLDKLKDTFCEENNIQLLRVHWKDIEDVEYMRTIVQDFYSENNKKIIYTKNYPI